MPLAKAITAHHEIISKKTSVERGRERARGDMTQWGGGVQPCQVEVIWTGSRRLGTSLTASVNFLGHSAKLFLGPLDNNKGSAK